jgi:hypothetical protein
MGNIMRDDIEEIMRSSVNLNNINKLLGVICGYL